MARTTDVAIVGGGVIGCSIAYHLAKRGIKSTVFEQGRFGSGASGASAGMVSPLWHVDHTHDALFAMGLGSLHAFPTLATELAEVGIDPVFRKRGILKVAMTAEEAETLKTDLPWQQALGLDVGWLEPDEVLEREPHVSPRVHGGVFSPREGCVSGQRLVDALVHAARRMGAQFVEGAEVGGLQSVGARVTGVCAEGQVVYADEVVLATGAWTGLAGRWTPGRDIPIRPVKGQRAVLRKAGVLPSAVVCSFANGTTVPQPDGSILVGATRHEGEFDDVITADGVASVLGDAMGLLPALRDAVFVSATAGVRPGSPDNVPLLGPVPDREGLSVAAGHDATGIMLSPATGELMADYIATGDASALEPFSPARFGSSSG